MDAIKAAQELLPAWVVWGNVLVYPALSLLLTLVSAFLAVSLASFSRQRMKAVSTWTERARLSYPARVAGRSVALAAPFFCGGMAFLYCVSSDIFFSRSATIRFPDHPKYPVSL